MDQSLLDFTVDLARRAGAFAAQRFFAGDVTATRKSDGTEVTATDLAVEELIRDALARHAPGDEVYGEEAGTTKGTTGRRWVIDPIDGTYYFTHRIPLFATMLAYEDEQGPAIGVIHEPIARKTVFAGRGLGCWVAFGDVVTRARVGDRSRLTGARTVMGNPGTWSEELLATLHRTVYLSSVGDMAGLVTGELDAMVVAGFPMGYEDLAPLPVIVTEAGGRVTDLTGAPLLTGNGTVLVTNSVLHDEFLALLDGIPHARDYKKLTG
ncbi:inositol monophosphatase family protein [Actinophytocola sp. NPDC049390]|uniref:inositol monophosphatase family protein n=1 Tax=Actinophytocola sp. NPDC049390 TaxID=3363894 RepID=UPI00379DCC28